MEIILLPRIACAEKDIYEEVWTLCTFDISFDDASVLNLSMQQRLIIRKTQSSMHGLYGPFLGILNAGVRLDVGATVSALQKCKSLDKTQTVSCQGAGCGQGLVC